MSLLKSSRTISILIVMSYYIIASYILWMQRSTATGILASSYSLMANNLSAHDITDWKIAKHRPFCYRALFRWLVLGIARLAPAFQTRQGFFAFFLLINWICIGTGALVLYLFFRTLQFSQLQASLGGWLFLSCFPILFSHEFPVNTRGDLLAYILITVTLIFVVKDNPWGIMLVGSLGAITRENSMIAVWPYWFLSRRHWQQRLAAIIVPSLMLFFPRWLYGLDSWTMRRATTLTSIQQFFGRPIETGIYVFMTFGVLWVFAGRYFSLAQARKQHPLLSSWIFPGALALMFSANILLAGYVRENRIFFVVFPWVLGLASLYLCSEECKRCFSQKSAWITALISIGVWSTVLWYVYHDLNFAKNLKQFCGGIFEPGFQPHKGPAQTILRGTSYRIIYFYSSTPWGAVYLYFHLTVLASYMAGFLRLRASSEEHGNRATDSGQLGSDSNQKKGHQANGDNSAKN